MKINRFIQTKPLTPEQQKLIQEKQMREAAGEYEKYFLNEMVKAMRSTVPEQDGLIKQNFAEKIYKENLDQEYVKNWSKAGGIGLADLIYEQLQQQVEGIQNAQGPAKPLKTGALPVSPEKGIAAYEKQGSDIKRLDD